MPRQCRHLILLYPLLLIPFLIRSQQRHQDTLILHFPLSSYKIQPPDDAHLREALNSCPDSISIIGYTDKTGTIAFNQRLSQQRANAAYRYVRQTAASARDGQVIGGGIAPTPERSDSENRRVEIVLYYNEAAQQIEAAHEKEAHANETAHETDNPGYDTIRAARPTRNLPSSGDTLVVTTLVPDTANGKSDSAQPSAIISLLHINFIVDTPIPTDTTQKILPKYVEQLRRFSDHHLEIDGFVNSIYPLRGAKDPLFILSVRRAKFIYDYLVNAGFDPGKLTYKGMGNATPINPTPLTRAEMNANMRVEIKVY